MDGIIVINKHKGCTSHDIVSKVKKLFNEKVGHTGTLDPMATGVLPLLIGKGTQCSKYLINHDKTYVVKLKLGQKTETADSEGKVIEEKEVKYEKLKTENVRKVLSDFLGKQKQIPPIYSAIKINGKKLYEYARQGKKVEIQPRNIEIYKINLLDINKDIIEFEVSCSKGTYIRSLCENIAEKLETVGYMCELKRTQVGGFWISNAIDLEELEKNIENEKFIKSHFINLEEIFKENKNIELNTKRLKLFLNGVQIEQVLEDGTYKIYNNNKFIGTGIVKNKILKRDIII